MYKIDVDFGFYDLSGMYTDTVGEYESFYDALVAYKEIEDSDMSKYKGIIKEIINEISDKEFNDSENINNDDNDVGNINEEYVNEDDEDLFNQLFIYCIMVKKDDETIVWNNDWESYRGYVESLTEEEKNIIVKFGFEE